ncbi:hypothetical protein FPSE_09760 [Fusarium pseudograminearum CS3096]|uniref:chitinase n=1 Tax=Fusarium pseudograminearum (strain CS3096) TaxID=1028729 RepID=K3V8S5_FUSPC|nr:hypothetical protein FPSE_09760 [Fusarium pseudograminearum CS3096]EKJ70067.1 hypothetical protein FPSE_09760 [Fusarium pseudograminearum CS3096]
MSGYVGCEVLTPRCRQSATLVDIAGSTYRLKSLFKLGFNAMREGGSLKTSAACVDGGEAVRDKLGLGTSQGLTHNKTVVMNTVSLLQGMKKYFDAKDNCNKNLLFGYHGDVVVGLYIGAGLGKPTVSSAFYSLSLHLETAGSIANRTIVQFRDLARKANRVFGILLDTTGDIAAIQETTRQWSEGSSTVGKDVVFSGSLSNAKVYDIAGITHLPELDEPTSTPTPTPSLSNEPKKLRERLVDFVEFNILRERATCKHIVVGDGDSCATLARRCVIQGSDFAKYNSESGFCSFLEKGGPKPEADGTCATHVIDDRDTCAKRAKKHSVSVKELEKWNKNTWAWTDCTGLLAKNANTDGSYTHIHWAFASIDSQTWKPIIKEGKDQWADSTAPDKYSIIRNAIITNRETFATNLVKFAKDEGLDGVDIDWEYPGAEDILVGGSPIGAKTDGVNYLRFLTTLREKLGSDMSLSIAAPASYWYLKAFPIDRISKVVDYIVYMTYDLHGQWDYGNPNAFDEFNMTETRRALSMITKAGVANNKIFVGESSYGRSFRMAKSDCWKPECEFTGSKAVSDAAPGRCDYISYMTDNDKLGRRVIWKDFNFAGTIDWAVDLQQFRNEDFDAPPDIPMSGLKQWIKDSL